VETTPAGWRRRGRGRAGQSWIAKFGGHRAEAFFEYDLGHNDKRNGTEVPVPAKSTV